MLRIGRYVMIAGLWLSVAAFWNDNGDALAATLAQGLATADHATFCAQLSRPIFPAR
ncbi:MAG: hypothetical protein U0Q16_15820 [Bryobacteraceae bacterium]